MADKRPTRAVRQPEYLNQYVPDVDTTSSEDCSSNLGITSRQASSLQQDLAEQLDHNAMGRRHSYDSLTVLQRGMITHDTTLPPQRNNTSSLNYAARPSSHSIVAITSDTWTRTDISSHPQYAQQQHQQFQLDPNATESTRQSYDPIVQQLNAHYEVMSMTGNGISTRQYDPILPPQRNVIPQSHDGRQQQQQLHHNQGIQWQRQNSYQPGEQNPSSFATNESIDRLRTEMILRFDSLKTDVRQLMRTVERELCTEFPTKPECLPFTSIEQVIDFDHVQEHEYMDIVRYLGSLGGYTLTETCNEVLKNAVDDSVSPALTWHGRKENELSRRKLARARARALYASVAKNRNYPRPDWAEFADGMTNALRSAKQRYRNRSQRMERSRAPLRRVESIERMSDGASTYRHVREGNRERSNNRTRRSSSIDRASSRTN